MTARLLIARAVAVLAVVALGNSAANAQVGKSCSPFSPCSKGYSCQPLVQKCYNSPRQEGQPCSAGFSCGSGLRCAAGVQKCVPENAAPTGALEKGAASVAAAVPQSCPDMQLKCPTGENFARGTSWDAGRLMCRPSNTMEVVLRAKCPSPYMPGQLFSPNPTVKAFDRNAAWYAQSRQAAACSAPGKALEVADSEIFNDACIIHDLCYRSPMTKSACDQQFLQNQQAVCYKAGLPSTLGVAPCLAQANNNYLALLTPAGQAAYDEDQRAFGLKR